MYRLIRIATIPVSLKILLRGQHKYMCQYFQIIGVSSSGSALDEVATHEGIRVESVNMTRQISPFKDLYALWKLIALFKREKPHIVHTHTPKAGTLGMIAACLARVPIRIHTVAGLPLLETKGYTRYVLNKIEKITYSCASMVYPNSFGLKQIIIKNSFCEDSKLKVLCNGSSNGIDTHYYSNTSFKNDSISMLRQDNGIKKSDFVFIFIGRLVGDKGINELVMAFVLLKKQYTDIKLLLVGQNEHILDSLEPNTIYMIKKCLDIIDTGFQDDVRPFLSISNAFVFPSYREGFPNVVMQAGAMGLPSIVTDINGCNEIIIDGINGVIIPPKNVDALKKAMEEFIIYSDMSVRLSKNARKMIVDRYDQEMIWKAIKNEYDFLLNEKGLL